MQPTAPLPPVPGGKVAAVALGVGVLVDLASDGPAGAGVVIAASAVAVSLARLTHPRAAVWVFLLPGVALSSFAVVRASPVLIAIDVVATFGLFGLAGGFARGGEPLRSGVRTYAIRSVAWVATSLPAVTVLVRSLAPGSGGSRRLLPRAVLITLPVGLIFAMLLGSADAVFADLVRSPFEELPLADAPRHVAAVIVGALAFGALTLRSLVAPRATRLEGPIVGGGLRPVEWTTLLATVDALFALFVAVQFVTRFDGRERVLHQAGLTYAEYARSGFWQLLAAAALTGIVVAGTWIGGRPEAGREQRRFVILATSLVGLSLVVLVSGFQRLLLYEDAFGFTWPRLLGHAATILTGTLLVAGAFAVIVRRAAWLPSGAIALGVLTVMALNVLDPEAFIAERNLARAAVGHPLDVMELRSLSVDAVPAIVEALPSLSEADRAALVGSLADLRCELVEEAAGFPSFNAARARAERILEAMPRDGPPAC
jgi:Domain of unknown function (DUF4173)